MNNRNEKILDLISELRDKFYDTPDKFFVGLVKTLIDLNYSDEDIKRMVNKAIHNVPKTKLTVCDFLNGYAKSFFEFVVDGKRCYGDKSAPMFIPDDAPPRPNNNYGWCIPDKKWIIHRQF